MKCPRKTPFQHTVCGGEAILSLPSSSDVPTFKNDSLAEWLSVLVAMGMVPCVFHVITYMVVKTRSSTESPEQGTPAIPRVSLDLRNYNDFLLNKPGIHRPFDFLEG